MEKFTSWNQSIEAQDRRWSPATLCMVFMLNRALRDLVEGERHVRKQAIKWLSNETKKGLPRFIAYKDVIEVLELTESRRQIVRDRIEYAKMLLECKNLEALQEIKKLPPRIRMGQS